MTYVALGGTRSARLKFIIFEKALMARTFAAQSFDFGHGADAAARAERGAVQSGRGAGEFKYYWKWIATQECIGEAGMEYVPCTCGVDSLDAEGGAVVKLGTVPGEDAVASERSTGDATAKAPGNFRE